MCYICREGNVEGEENVMRLSCCGALVLGQSYKEWVFGLLDNQDCGLCRAVFNIGPTLPPQRKGRLPQYNRNTTEELQDKFDELKAAGVFANLNNC